MASFISKDQKSMSGLAAQTEEGLMSIDTIARSGMVPQKSSPTTNRSHFFEVDGVLKYYNKSDGTTKTVTVT